MSYAALPHRSLGDQAEDIDAVALYMAQTPAKTPSARQLQDQFKVWLDGVSWWNKRYDRPTYDRARNLRNDFNLANATTPAGRAAAEQVAKTGLTTEQTTGGASRVSSEGRFSEADGGLLSDSTALWIKLGFGAAILAVGVYGLHELRLIGSVFRKGKTS